MDILVKVKTSSDQQDTGLFDHQVVINLRHMTMCVPENKGYTRVRFTASHSLLIKVKYENFIALLERLYGEKFIEMENDEEKSED